VFLADLAAPARAAMEWSAARTLPAIWLTDGAPEPWQPQRDLLASDRFARDFVVEVDNDGAATLRFGDGATHGRRPAGGSSLEAFYRVGNGRAGNVGVGAIAHVVTPIADILEVRNPLPARGGMDPESIDEVRQFAPQAFRIQQRAVTEADYAAVLERRADVQRGMATFRWTGSWHTAFASADRIGGDPAEPGFGEDLRRYLERFRMAGIDLEVRRPVFVPLHVEVTVCVKPGYFAADVKRRLLEALRGLFHPDAFTFGQPVYLSRVYEIVMSVDGVAHADVTTFQRWGSLADRELENALLVVGGHEIARLDNDPNYPENGKLVLTMAGGL
jgi:predicted phage baseplate assembly protein